MPHLEIVVVSTRPGRKGPAVARWFEGEARRHGAFDIGVADLGEINLPMMDEPRHPRFQQYEHAHTKAWSARISAADAFVFVTPEYNHSAPPSLVNAIDYLVAEWGYKPAGFVSYGGISGGLRGVQHVKPLLCGLKMVPVVEMVTLTMFTRFVDEATGAVTPDATHAKAAGVMLDELLRWTNALRVLR